MTSCAETPLFNPPPQLTPAKGVYVLNQGLFQRNNATLSYYDLEQGDIEPDIFERVNGRRLGDTGNDLGLYGGKLYAVIHASSRIEVIDPRTALSLATIPLFDSSGVLPRARLPRKMAFGGRYVFISCFDGSVHKLDTLTLNIVAQGRAGRQPEGIGYARGKIYVANSGGLDFPNYDSTLTILSASDLKPLKTLSLRINLTQVAVYQQNTVFVLSQGDYLSIPPRLFAVSTLSDSVIGAFMPSISRIALSGDTLLYYDGAQFGIIHAGRLMIENASFLPKGSLTTPFGFTRDPLSGEIFITDALNYTSSGRLYRFSASGQMISLRTLGLIPSEIVFLR